jgi:hypothetical protein
MTMPRYTATFAANVRAYACVTVIAADEDAAHERFKQIADVMNNNPEDWPAEVANTLFEPEYDTLGDYDYLEDCGLDDAPDNADQQSGRCYQDGGASRPKP